VLLTSSEARRLDNATRQNIAAEMNLGATAIVELLQNRGEVATFRKSRCSSRKHPGFGLQGSEAGSDNLQDRTIRACAPYTATVIHKAHKHRRMTTANSCRGSDLCIVFKLSWYSPLVELKLCGHGTLAASAILYGRLPSYLRTFFGSGILNHPPAVRRLPDLG